MYLSIKERRKRKKKKKSNWNMLVKPFVCREEHYFTVTSILE